MMELQREDRPLSDGGRRAGFTLIELLIVCVIIGILIGILLPALYRSKYQAKVQQTHTEIKAIRTAIMAYRLNTGEWPANDLDGQDGQYSNDNMEVVGRLTSTVPPLLEITLVHPAPLSGAAADPWGDPYIIRIDKDNDNGFRGGSNDLMGGVAVSSARIGGWM